MNPIEDLVRVSRNDYKTVVGEMKEKGKRMPQPFGAGKKLASKTSH